MLHKISKLKHFLCLSLSSLLLPVDVSGPKIIASDHRSFFSFSQFPFQIYSCAVRAYQLIAHIITRLLPEIITIAQSAPCTQIKDQFGRLHVHFKWLLPFYCSLIDWFCFFFPSVPSAWTDGRTPHTQNSKKLKCVDKVIHTIFKSCHRWGRLSSFFFLFTKLVSLFEQVVS